MDADDLHRVITGLTALVMALIAAGIASGLLSGGVETLSAMFAVDRVVQGTLRLREVQSGPAKRP